MLIVAKYKDYYDYLSGIWGADPKIVLKRDSEFVVQEPEEGDVFTFIIGGNMIQYFFKDGKAHFGKDVEKYDEKYYYNSENFYQVATDFGKNRRAINPVAKEVLSGYDFLNKKYNAPILFNHSTRRVNIEHDTYHTYPLLSSTDIAKFIPPEDMYKMISDYISKEITERENLISSEPDNNNKIISKGFDLKKSFRPKIKKK